MSPIGYMPPIDWRRADYLVQIGKDLEAGRITEHQYMALRYKLSDPEFTPEESEKSGR